MAKADEYYQYARESVAAADEAQSERSASNSCRWPAPGLAPPCCWKAHRRSRSTRPRPDPIRLNCRTRQKGWARHVYEFTSSQPRGWNERASVYRHHGARPMGLFNQQCF
jgi:hypothetical protein